MSSGAAKKSIKNIVLSFSSQIIILALGLILPRLFITGLGSEVNGFFSTVTQLYCYLEILRAGVGTAAVQALYKPIVENDIPGISKITSTARSYFRKLGRIYLICSLLISIGFVLLGGKNLSRTDVFLIAAMQGISGWISFSLINWFVDLLRAEGKNYVFVAIQTIGQILIKAAEIVLVYTTQNPVLIKSATLVLIFLEFIAFSIYRKKRYAQYNFDVPGDFSLLKNRNSYLVFQITGQICANTDVVVLSIFCGYEVSSVYAVYFLVVFGVNTIINTMYSSTAFLLGHSYQHGLEYFRKIHDSYYLLYTTLTKSLFSVFYILIFPFIKLYTAGVTDINYIYAFLPLLFCVTQILACSKNVGDMAINIGGLAKKVVWRASLEAGLNIILSIIFVQFWGIYGVLMGTVVALGYRTIDVLIFSNKYVLGRHPFKNAFVFICNALLFGSVVLINGFIDIQVDSYWQFAIYGLWITPLVLFVFFGIMLLINREEAKIILGYVKRKMLKSSSTH